MTTITAKSILASQHADAPFRVDTLLLRYPRWIHAEARAHRVLRIGEQIEMEAGTPSLMEDAQLSRNASSSRAIPVAKLIADVLADPAIPLYWGKNRKGMQAFEELEGRERRDAEEAWRNAMAQAVAHARLLDRSGAHKQIVNRVLEPYSHITVVVTGTEWSNFFALRDHPDAEPHIRMLAKAIKTAMAEARVQVLRPGEWHLPFVTAKDGCEAAATGLDGAGRWPVLDEPTSGIPTENLIKLSVARCASASYKTVDGFDMSLDRAIALHDKLVSAEPIHASPLEHQCYADEVQERRDIDDEAHYVFRRPREHANLRGFCQYRKSFEGESIEAGEATKPWQIAAPRAPGNGWGGDRLVQNELGPLLS